MPELHDAVYTSNLEKLKCFLNEGEDVNAKDENGLKPLDIAIIKNETKIVEYLLGADFKDKIVIDMPVWKYAMTTDNDVITSLLLEYHGHTISKVKDSYGMQPIHYAVINRCLKVLMFCITNEIDVNVTTFDGFTALHYAIIHNNVNMIEILKCTANMNIKTMDGSSVLHLAVKHQSLNCLNMLIKEMKIDINEIVTSSGLTALHIAVKNGDEEMVNLLMNSGAVVNVKDKKSYSLLHAAVEQKNKNIVNLFLKKGLDVNDLTQENCTPLELALKNKSEDIVKMIMNYNPDLTIKNKEGKCPLFTAIEYNCCSIEIFSLQTDLDVLTGDHSSLLHYALKYDNLHIVNCLLEKNINVGAVNMFGETVLHYAARYCLENIVDMIVSKKRVDVNSKMINGLTPLHYTLEHKSNHHVVATLLRHGADVNAENNKKETPLHTASRRRSPSSSCVEELLKNGANPNHKAADNTSPLYWAITNARTSELTKILIKYGAHVNNINENNDNVLHVIFRNCCPTFRGQFLEMVLENEVDVNGINNEGETPIEVCLRSGILYSIEVELLEKHGLNFNIVNKYNENALHWSIEKRNIDVMEKYLQQEPDLMKKTCNGLNLLHYAVQHGSEDIEYFYGEENDSLKKVTDILLADEKMSDYLINSKDNRGRTALHIAASRGLIKTTKTLLSKEANINAKDNNEDSPLCYAIRAQDIEMVKLLLENGARVNGKNKDEHSILDIAEKEGNKHIYKFLLLR